MNKDYLDMRNWGKVEWIEFGKALGCGMAVGATIYVMLWVCFIFS